MSQRMKRMRVLTGLLALAAAPAAAQEATPTAPAEPVPLFQAACSTSTSVTPGRPRRMFSRTVMLNR